MALTYDGTNGLFTRLGRLGDLYLNTITTIGSGLDTAIEDIRDEFETGAEAQVIDNIYAVRDAYRSSPASLLSALQTYCQNVLIEQIHTEVNLPSKTLAAAVLELKRLMVADSETISRPTISASHAAWASNIGDGVFVTSMTNEYGVPYDMAYAEDVRFTCTADTSSGNTQYRETFTISGEPSVAVTHKDWPQGSGASGTITLFDAGTQNDLISNGGFDTWTNSAAAPDSWTIVTGAAGSTIERDGTTVKRGQYACRLDSDGSTLLTIKQQLSTSLVKPNRVYLLNLWAKMDTTDASGVVRFRLCDGAGNTLTNDEGTSQSYTRNTNGQIAATWTNISTAFQTKRQLPSTGVFLEIGFTTSPANSRTLSLDLIGLKEGQSLYTSGPKTAGFSAATNNAIGDYNTVTIANNASNASFVRFLQRVLGLLSMGPQYTIPSVASTNTIDDALLA